MSHTQDNLDLKPCPICGAQPRVRQAQETDQSSFWVIECPSKMLPGTTGSHAVAVFSPSGGDLKDAVKLWNTRCPMNF